MFLQLPVKTRWGSFKNCLESLIKNKSTLQHLAVSDDMKYVFNWITSLESDSPKISVVPEALNEIKQNFITNVPISPLLEVEGRILLKKIDERYNMAIHPIHFAANLIDPKYQGKNLKDGCDINNEIDARTWCNGICTNTQLSKVPSAILSLPASSAATERSLSLATINHIHYYGVSEVKGVPGALVSEVATPNSKHAKKKADNKTPPQNNRDEEMEVVDDELLIN
ncbi:hypothetical protein AGLY_003343, partial [Aphis glycines]